MRKVSPVSPPTGQQRDLKWSLAGVQLFSSEGLDTCVRILQKVCGVLLQPWRMHGHMGPTPLRCMILSVCIGTLRLLRAMLTELLRGGAFQFRDTRVANVLVTLHMIVCSIPASGRLDGEEMRMQALIVDVLLTFTQGVNEEVRVKAIFQKELLLQTISKQVYGRGSVIAEDDEG